MVEHKIEIGGDVSNSSLIQGPVTGSNIISGKTEHSTISTSASITINKTYLENMPAEYRESLIKLQAFINKKIIQDNIPSERVQPVNESMQELAKVTSDANLKQGISETKKKSIRDRLVSFSQALAKMSPAIAQAVIAATPLSPFSNLIGEAVESIVQAAL